MLPVHLIAIRHLEIVGRRIPVLLSRNERGSVAGRVVLADDDAPILDGPDIDSVLKVIQEQLEWLLLARQRSLT
jgi:hypothetical protein